MDSASERFSRYYEPVPESGCWLWTGGCTSRYGLFWPGYELNGGKQMAAHRYSFYLENGILPASDTHILHKCDTPLCVNPAHLVAGNHADNMRDKAKKNRVVAPTKISKQQAEKARVLYNSGMTVKAVAELFSIHPSHMGRILKANYRKLDM